MADRPILIATRGSALALAQANQVLAQCRAAFPKLEFELEIIKTTGDKLQEKPLYQLPGKGHFIKEIEAALQIPADIKPGEGNVGNNKATYPVIFSLG